MLFSVTVRRSVMSCLDRWPEYWVLNSIGGIGDGFLYGY